MRTTDAFIGIDPGVSGGISLVSDSLSYGVPMPKTEADIAQVIRELRDSHSAVFCLIEKVHAMPKQGVSSTFTFGKNYGFLRGCLSTLKVPFEDVTPRKWQQSLGCLSGGDKNVTKQKAQQLFPELKITHAIADALLIGEYGRRTFS